MKVYFDHAATTPLRKEVLRKMMPFLTEKYGNPSALYGMGREARKAIIEARSEIAKVLHCSPEEFIFTNSATESDQLALLGVARANKDKGNKIIISSVEHKGIASLVRLLKKEGLEVVTIPVCKNGLLDLEKLKEEIDAKTILVSVTMADSETGTIQPIAEIAKVISHKLLVNRPLFHTDATQGAVYLDVNVKKLGVDLLTISAHKLGGPKGVAGLYVRKGVLLERPPRGTENVAAIVGFGEAVKLSKEHRVSFTFRIKKLRDLLEKNILKNIPKVILNGHPTKRLPNFCNISFLDIEGEAILLHLDEHGIMASTGSACDAENLKPSAVLTAMGNPYEFVHGSIRFTLGSDNTMSEVKYVLKTLPKIVETLRKISPLCLTL